MKKRFIIITILSMLSGIISPMAQTIMPQKLRKRRPATKKFTKSMRPAGNRQSSQTPAKFALLVGINDYTDRNIKDLSGGENDVRLMREMLSEVYGFKPGTEIKELLSSSAKDADKPKQQAILDNFDGHLIANAKDFLRSKGLQPVKDANKGATVVFYYSGHGSHLPDNENKDEADGEDETIVPMDSDMKGTKDIRDDEFDKRFAELKKYTSNITFIFDSCHSGTITRGTGDRSLNRQSSIAAARGDGTDTTLNENMDSSGEGYVTISGSLPNEKSWEAELPNLKTKKPETNGYLTYHLVQALREMPEADYFTVMKRVKAAVQKQNSDQHPQVEGDVNRVVFGAAVSGGNNAINVLEVEKDGKNSLLKINAGKMVGAYPGGAVAVYKKAGDAERLAVGEIIEPTDDFTATVKVLETAVPETARVVLASPFFGSNKRVVALDLMPKKDTAEKDDAGLKMIRRLSEKLKKNDYVSPKTLLNPLQESTKSWNAALVRTTYGEFKKGNRQPPPKNPANLPRNEDEIYYLSSTNGTPLYNFWVRGDEANIEDVIQTAFERFVRVDNLRTLGNESAEMNKGLQLKIVKLKSAAAPPVGSSTCAVVEDGALQNPLLNPGEWFVMEITNSTGEALFPYLYNIGAGGAVKLLYEPKAEGDILRNNVTMRTWGARKCAVFRASAPYGTETFKLIAASRMFNGKLLESPSLVPTRSKGVNPLEDLLAQASTNTRDVETVTFEFNGWATASMDIEIKEK